jgi:hypothetical protein
MNTRAAVILIPILLTPAGYAQNLDALMHRQDYTAHRASSSDPSGGNLDMRRVEAGKTLTLAELKGPGVVTHVWFTLMHSSRSALRKMVFRVYFDDFADPCVEAPLGDFFGLGHAQTYAYASQPLAVGTHSGLNSYWPMPFASKARLTMTNEGAQDCPALYYQIDYRTLDKPLPDGLYFHARYQQAFPPAKGEGDVRMFVDGESTPSISGTGSEDDFGGAWCYSHEFSFPYFGAPLRARFSKEGIWEHCTPDLKGKDLAPWRWPEAWKPGDLWNVYRYHIADPVPFKKSILVNIEHGWQNNERSDRYSSVAYWYQAGKPTARIDLPPLTDRVPLHLRPHDYGGGRWEGEDLVDAAKTVGGTVQEAGMDFWGDLFSNRCALEWSAEKPGDTLTLPFSVAKSGRYRVLVRMARVEPGGTFTVSLDDQPPGEPVNLYQPPPFPDLFDAPVAERDLEHGEHTLKFACIGADARSKGKRLMLDKIQIADK